MSKELNNEKEHIPYTYLIGWTKLNKFYYGVQYGDKAHPKNLWTKYFTSSRLVSKYRKEYGEPDVIEVRQTFDCKKKALMWESKVIFRINAINSNKWLNKCNCAYTCDNIELMMGSYGEKNGFYGKKHSVETRLKISENSKKNARRGVPLLDEVKQKISKTLSGRKIPDEVKKKISDSTSGSKNHRYGKKLSEEQKNALGRYVRTPEIRQKLSQFHTGRKMSEESKHNMSLAQIKRDKILCEYCNQLSDPGNYHQHHGDMCIMNENNKRLHCEYCDKKFIPSKYNKFHGDKCKCKPIE